MPSGVPEAEVSAAADRILARGERPTVERVRAELGRGSPARVGRLLEAWWDALAKRLAGETRLPELPAEVAAAFHQVWQAAVHEGRAQVEAVLAEHQQALTHEHAALQAERERFGTALSEAQTARQQSDRARELAEVRLQELERLSQQQAAQIADLQIQRDALQRRADQRESDITALVEKQRAQERSAAEERRLQAERVRVLEDRAHAEIDRARQENKALQRESTELQRCLRSLEQTLSAALKREATLQSKISTLQQQTKRRAQAQRGQKCVTTQKKGRIGATKKRAETAA